MASGKDGTVRGNERGQGISGERDGSLCMAGGVGYGLAIKRHKAGWAGSKLTVL